MKTRLNKILSIILVAVMLLSALPFTASAEELSGTCGDNLTWSLDTETGELLITGTGAMDNYDYNNRPWRSSIKSVTISDGVTTIGNYAFCNCYNLTSVTIPDSVTTIGEWAFSDCYNLTNAFYTGTKEQWANIYVGYFNDDLLDCTILEYNSERTFYAPGKCGNNLIYYLYTDGELIVEGTGAMHDFGFEYSPLYRYRSLIKSVTISDGVTTIGEYAFLNCTSLTSITIPDSVTTIGSGAFRDCTSLESVTIGNSVITIGGHAFLNCISLTSVTIPNNVTTIEYGAFSGCESLKSATIGKGITTIENDAFASCPELEEVIFTADAPLTIGDYVFDYSPKAMICCEAGSWLHFYASSNGLRFCLFDGDGVPAFEIKNNVLISYRGQSENACVSLVNQIGYGAFENNSTIKNIEIAKSVNIIYNNAFKNCTELKSVIIPQSVTSIGATAFDGCDNLTIWCYAGSYADEYAQSHNIDVEYINLRMDKDVVHLNPSATTTLTYTFNTPLAENVSIVWESTDKSVVTVDAFGNIKGVKAGTAVVVATSRDGSMRDYCVVKVVGVEALSTVTIDYDNGFITGIESNTTSLDGLIAMTDSTCSLSYTTLGTDSVVYVQRDNEIVDAYTVLIFGDVNGDGWYDGTDSIIVSCLANGLLTQDSVSEVVYRAADCNHDGVIDSFDVAILEQAGLLLANVDQSKSNEELASDAAFIEYLDLIDQTPEDETVEDETPEIPEPPETEPETEEFDLIEFIITIIKKFFELLLSTLPIK